MLVAKFNQRYANQPACAEQHHPAGLVPTSFSEQHVVVESYQSLLVVEETYAPENHYQTQHASAW